MIVQVKWKLVYENLAFSTNVLLYFVNSARYGHSYNGRRMSLVCDVAISNYYDRERPRATFSFMKWTQLAYAK